MANARTLHVRCATWEQVEVFITRKLRKGRFLSMKVPFLAKLQAPVTLGLELPNQLTIAIDGIVQKASPVDGDPGKTPPPGQTRTWIEIELVGLTEDVLARIRSLAKQATAPPEDDEEAEIHIEADEPLPAPPQRPSQVLMAQTELPADERELFLHLSGELRRLRSAAVHEVLGVARDAGPDQVRIAWKALIRKHHPDLVSRRGAPAITHLAEELTILANRAYDRLRAALVAEGRGSVAGPGLSAPPGWLVGFEDLASERTPPPGSVPRVVERMPSRPTRAQTNPGVAPPAASTSSSGGDAFEARARAMLAQGDAATAREVLAAALVVFPRSKALRSLYYVATALGAIKEGGIMLAQSQLETALAHHEQCVEAAQMLEHLRKHGGSNTEAMQRFFA